MRIHRRWLLLPLFLIAIPLLPDAYLLAGAAFSPFSWRERDWNRDGRTTLDEFQYGIDLGKRPAPCTGGRPGTEYFLLKDGMPFLVDCTRRWSGPPDARW